MFQILNKKIHIVSFDVPYPANYGGIIDVFYKIKSLHALGVEIYLHTFEYGKGKQQELNKYCKNVFYYPRNSFIKSFFSISPFIVKTRTNRDLLNNLLIDESPIIFEGIHTTQPILDGRLNTKKTFIRAHNIEHLFYKGLANSESNFFKRNFFKQESKKLKKYEDVYKKANGVFSISPSEQDYFKKKYGDKCVYIPAFHDTEKHTELKNSGNYVLYHGNLLVSENVKAVLFLIDTYKNSDYELVIASSYINYKVSSSISKYENIRFQHLQKETDLFELFEKAHINVLPTFQNTGIKLKLLNTLYQGKFIIANDLMVDQTGLKSLCDIANTKTQFLEKTEELFQKKFEPSREKERRKILKNFAPDKSAKKMLDIMFR